MAMLPTVRKMIAQIDPDMPLLEPMSQSAVFEQSISQQALFARELPRHVFGAHVHDTFEPKMRGDCGCGDSVLACSGFCYHARLFHLYRQQSLADGVVDFVRAGVQKIFALEIDARAASVFGQALREKKWSWSTCKIPQQSIELCLETLVRARRGISCRQFFERRHQSFRHKAASVTAPVAKRIRFSYC